MATSHIDVIREALTQKRARLTKSLSHWEYIKSIDGMGALGSWEWREYEKQMSEATDIDAALASLSASRLATGAPVHRYSHRNGEAEAPTINGDFWFDGHDDDGKETKAKLLVTEDSSGRFALLFDTKDRRSIYRLSHLTGKWWGPVTPPWDTPQPAQSSDAWEPLPDGEYSLGADFAPLLVTHNNDTDANAWLSYADSEVMLGTDMAVCRRQAQVSAVAADDVRDAIAAALGDLISSESEETYRAMWYSEIEYLIWARLQGDEHVWWEIDESVAERLRIYSKLIDGWVVYDPDLDDASYVDMEAWLVLFGEWQARHAHLWQRPEGVGDAQ